MARESKTAASAALIAQLAGDLAPVRRRWPLWRHALVWLGIQAIVAVPMTLALGLRGDLVGKLETASFSAEVIGLVVLSGTAVILALLAAVPGREPRPGPAAIVLVIAAVALGTAYGAGTPGDELTLGWTCAVKTLAVAVLPWIALLVALYRGAPLAPALSGALAGAGTLAAAALVVRVTCPVDERWHLLLWHLAPVVLGCGASLLAGARLLAHWRRAG